MEIAIDASLNDELLGIIKKCSTPLQTIPTGCPTKLEQIAVRCVIFDVYGTLLISAAGDVGPDSAGDDEPAFKQALLDGGITLEDLADDTQGIDVFRDELISSRDQLTRLGVCKPEIDILQVWHNTLQALGIGSINRERLKVCAMSYECRVNPVWPMPGALAVIEYLQKQGCILGILSNAQFYTELILQTLFSQPVQSYGFTAKYCLYSYREGIGKPSSILFKKLNTMLQKEGVRPDEILYVGNDFLKDIFPAHEVGWKTAFFVGDYRSMRLRDNDSQLDHVEPDLIIDDLRQLMGVIKKKS